MNINYLVSAEIVLANLTSKTFTLHKLICLNLNFYLYAQGILYNCPYSLTL